VGTRRVGGAHEQHPPCLAPRQDRQRVQRAGNQPQVGAAAVAFGTAAGDDPGLFQHPQVVGEQIGRHRQHRGHYVTPSTQTVAAAAAQKPDITPTDFSIVNQPGASSYPISGYSWALVYTRQQNQATGQALVAMLVWLTHDGQASAAANGYVPLPPQIQQLARTMLQQIAGPTGTHLLG
jgi:hypothetical protein